MSCYDKHPDAPGIECWHAPDHAGDHGKEGRSWPNLKDPLRVEIARLTGEVERLRNGQVRPIPWTDDEIKELIKEAVESDPNGKCIHCGGIFPKAERNHWRDCPEHTARIEVERLRKERVEVLALLDAHPVRCNGSDDGDDDPPCLPCLTRALVAKLRGAP